MELKVGSNDQNTDGQVTPWQEWAYRYAASYAAILGPIDGYYGYSEEAFVKVLQQKAGVPITGRFDDLTAAKCGFKWKGSPKPSAVSTHRPIWVYSAPGSGVPWHVGPPFDLGEWVKKDFNLNHQPLGYPIGGYMGLMGGDPAFSYNDVLGFIKAELRRQILLCPDLNSPALEIWLFGYSQSADGLKTAVNELFGDGGEFRDLRKRINGIIAFGDPTRAAGVTRVGNNPPGSGISRKVFPEWLEALTWSITNNGDFYACTQGDLIPLFYEWFVRAESELPFVIYSAQIIIPALLNLVAPFLGTGWGLNDPLAGVVLASVTGLKGNTLGSLIGGVSGSSEAPNPKLIELLSIKGILTNLPALVGLLAALPGIQTHGEYHLNKPEFNGASGLRVGYDAVRLFRR